VRIAGGRFRGTNLYIPKGYSVRPTLSKTRQAIFNVLRPYIKGAKAMDFFAGSGALGFEALSEGAQNVVFVEKKYSEYILRNAGKLKAGKNEYKIIPGDYRAALRIISKKKLKADIILADPPYNEGCVKKFLYLLGKNDILNECGLVVVETHRDEAAEVRENPGCFEILREKIYGEAVILILEKKGGEGNGG